ncbi:MAG: hypothetical protein RSD49_15720 [Hafnia sp.]
MKDYEIYQLMTTTERAALDKATRCGNRTDKSVLSRGLVRLNLFGEITEVNKGCMTGAARPEAEYREGQVFLFHCDASFAEIVSASPMIQGDDCPYQKITFRPMTMCELTRWLDKRLRVRTTAAIHYALPEKWVDKNITFYGIEETQKRTINELPEETRPITKPFRVH